MTLYNINQSMDNVFITEELNIGDNLEELVDSITTVEDMNVYYSFPYFSDDTYDFQYRLFIDDGEVILEDIKSNETEMDTADDAEIIVSYPRCDIKKGLEYISNHYDLRNLETHEVLTTSTEMINYNSEDDIENNKRIVLLELYKSIL